MLPLCSPFLWLLSHLPICPSKVGLPLSTLDIGLLGEYPDFALPDMAWGSVSAPNGTRLRLASYNAEARRCDILQELTL